MKKIYNNLETLKYVFILIALAIVVFSVWFTNSLAHKLATEESRKIEIWAEATRQFILADENTDIDFVSSIIEGNTTIPVYMVDDKDQIIFSRNVKEPLKNKEEFYAAEIARLKAFRAPIEVRLDKNTVQYIYYDDSLLLKQLHYFPYIQFSVIFVFLLMAFIAFSGTKKAEQNQVWVGLSKETAHQLGTPISSLLAWQELLKTKHPDDKLLPEMGKDINRLRIIAERFSKIGSQPELKQEDLVTTIENAINYMKSRTSEKVEISLSYDKRPIVSNLNVPLFEWVIENLCKNAIDAMNGAGKIHFALSEHERFLQIDVSDTGKGIERSRFKTIFKPGYTTKRRGWGLGLSLTKRIVESYHHGKIFVKQSEIGIGTTFRILLYK